MLGVLIFAEVSLVNISVINANIYMLSGPDYTKKCSCS